jgi:hypothetical protein
VSRLAWGALKVKFPIQENGLKTYFAYSRFDPDTGEGIAWPHNPAGLYAMLAESATSYYAYSGDREVIALVREALDYQLVHGTTPSDWDWASVPFASGEPGATDYGGADDEWCDFCGRGDGVGVIEPDKVAELGLAYLRFYEVTGDASYRDAAIACANALVTHVRDGDETRSPWAFRVYGRTNEAREEYSANVIAPIAFFDEMMRTDTGDTLAMRAARDRAWAWMMKYPMENDAWSGYFEDISTFEDPHENTNQYIALQTARYLMEHPEYDGDWEPHTKHILAWARDEFGGDANEEYGIQYGALVMSEQHADMAKMGSHTARYAAISAMYAERTGDEDAREHAFRSFNWATYMCSESGVVVVGEDKNEGYWFSDGYGDYIRHFHVGIAALPEWAPGHEDHLLRTTSVVRDVTYDDAHVAYETFDSFATDVVKLRARPMSVTVGAVPIEERASLDAVGLGEDGYVVQPAANGGYVVRVRRASASAVEIALGSEDAPPAVSTVDTPPSTNTASTPRGCSAARGRADLAGASLVALALLIGTTRRARRRR